MDCVIPSEELSIIKMKIFFEIFDDAIEKLVIVISWTCIMADFIFMLMCLTLHVSIRCIVDDRIGVNNNILCESYRRRSTGPWWRCRCILTLSLGSLVLGLDGVSVGALAGRVFPGTGVGEGSENVVVESWDTLDQLGVIDRDVVCLSWCRLELLLHWSSIRWASWRVGAASRSTALKYWRYK